MDNEKITQEVMEQYEELRQAGYTNMLDTNGVFNFASLMGLDALAAIAKSRKDYLDIIGNFSHYMKKYGIEQ